MRNVSATEAARRFSELLDAVEHRRQSFMIVRKGEPVARITPAPRANGAEVLRILRDNPRDAAWAAELRELRSLLRVEERDWRD